MIEKDRILNKAEEYKTYAVRLREFFHMHPELGSKEYITSIRIREELEKFSIPYEVTGNTSIIATIHGQGRGKTIAVRGDMDALPITEKNDLSFQSVNEGIMHACGHDLHITMALTAGRILNELKNEFHGTVKLIFEEGEEIGAGARLITEAGYLDDVDSAVALHVFPEEYTGKFNLGYGVRTASSCNLNIEVKDIDNPVLAAAEIMDLIHAKISDKDNSSRIFTLVPTVCECIRNTDKTKSYLRLRYNGRIVKDSMADYMKKIVTQAANETAKLHGSKAQVDYIAYKNAYIRNDKKCVDCAINAVESLYGEQALKITPPAMFSDTFELFSSRVPGLYILLGASDTKSGTLHNEKVIFSNDALQYGIGFLTFYILKMLEG